MIKPLQDTNRFVVTSLPKAGVSCSFGWGPHDIEFADTLHKAKELKARLESLNPGREFVIVEK